MTTKRAFQTEYNYKLGRNYYGSVARPNEPTVVDYGIAGESLKPGDAVVFDAADAERSFKKPVAGANAGATAANKANVVGIVLYDEGMVPDADGNVTIKDGDPVRVGVQGSFYAKAGSALEYGDQVEWDITNADWTLLTQPTTYATAHRNPAFCAERTVADAAIFVVRFTGRIR